MFCTCYSSNHTNNKSNSATYNMPPPSSPFILLTLCFLSGFYVTGKERCAMNRHIFTDKSGRIHDGENHYTGSSRCEWLIKGEPGETVSIKFLHFHTEYAYDRLYIHDGISQQSPLLASKTGVHNGITITSTGPTMYLVLHSDSGEQRSGFDLTYTINACPNNCSNVPGNNTSSSILGICKNDGSCNCLGSSYGSYCQYQWCADNLCNQAMGYGVCNVTEKKCVCSEEIYGESCSISEKPNIGSNVWYSVTTQSELFGSRAGHVSGYFNSINKLLVHGGFSLNSIHEDLVAFDFDLTTWKQLNSKNGIKPPAVYNHAAAVFRNTFIIFGGEQRQQQLSNQLWSYDVVTGSWTQIVAAISNVVPPIVGHSLVAVDSKLYIIGGRLQNGKASSNIYVFDLLKSVWSVKKPAYGKESSLRIFGHSSSYYGPINSIVVFGGFHLNATANVATNTNSLRVYNIKTNVWSILSSSRSSSIPPPISFHASVIAGHYLIIHGGWTGYQSYSITNAMFYYNLRCHVWVTEEVLTSYYNTRHKTDPKLLNKPVFSQSAVLKDNHTILISGGFDHISSIRSFIAYKLPDSVIAVNATTGDLVNTSHCRNQQEANCWKDPSCRFCTEQNICYSSHEDAPVGCSRADFKICSESCSVFTSCEACSSQTQCGWCSLNNACYNKERASVKCNLCYPYFSKFPNYGIESYSCDVETEPGWWGGREGNVLYSPPKCQTEDNPPGLTHVEYFAPWNIQHPDVVKILQRTEWEENAIGEEHKMRLMGKIYPYVGDSVNTKYTLDLSGVGVMVWLNVSVLNGVSETGNVTKLIKQKSEATSVTETDKRDGAYMRLFPVKAGDEGNTSSLWYDFLVVGTVDYALNPSLKIRWFKQTWNDYHFIERGFLKRYESKKCTQYDFCMGCITDASCGWCPSTDLCLSVDSPASSCKDDSNNSFYLQRRQEQCTVCTDHFDCESCINNKHCSWHISNGCRRKEYTNDDHPFLYVSQDNKFVSTCYANCSSHQTRDKCLSGHGCIWCTGRQSCLSFNDYIPQNLFGQCYTFFDHEHYKPKDCGLVTSGCDRCLQEFPCGWCHNEVDPRIGICSHGDFSGPSKGCLNDTSTALTKWSYDACPDVDECSLDIHDCKSNSTCVNEKNGYRCECDQGFEGDGKVKCVKTCWPPCGDHGTCSAAYTCICELGWKGDNCSVDCGCNGHSTCVNQTGVCDQCQDYTTGEFCEHCVNGSYGNATTSIGCKKCECHGFGDPALNECDNRDGECFCTNNTDGLNCERCKPGFSGNPKVGICVLSCERSNILKDATSGYVSPYTSSAKPGYNNYYDSCLWTIAAFNITHNEIIYGTKIPSSSPSNILFRVDTTHGMSCFDSTLKVYDGLPPNPRTQLGYVTSRFKLLGTVCGPKHGNQRQLLFRSTTGILTLFYQGLVATKPVKLDYKENGFLGEYTVMECPNSCPPPFVCIDSFGISNESCTCPFGRAGAMCELKICHNGCNNLTNQGTCDQATGDCICGRGFTGTDCSVIEMHAYYTMKHISNFHYTNNNNGEKIYSYVTYGSTMEALNDKDNNLFYVLGNTDSESEHYFHEYDSKNNQWKHIETTTAPTNRHLHCSFVYEGGMYIYGGITHKGFSNELWRYDLKAKAWYQLMYFQLLDYVAGHSCTLVGDDVYIIGGYVKDDGLNEYVYVINMKSNHYYPFKFEYPGGLEPVGVYSHIAIYDEITKIIYIHGGLAFFDEKIQLSSRTYSFNPQSRYWDYVQPYPHDEVPTLIGHVAFYYNDVVYILGGYNDVDGFNGDVYIWKLKCNRWSTVKRNDSSWQGDGRSNKLFSTAASVNGSFYMFGGLNDNIIPTMTVFTPPQDQCSVHSSKLTCLADHGCSWCKKSSSSPSNGICFHPSNPVTCSVSIERSTCTVLTNENRECSSFTTCDSCLSNYGKSYSHCHWCRCKAGQTSMCASRKAECNCIYPSVISTIDKCYQAKCGTSTCKNCNNGCFWTNHFLFKSENEREFKRSGFPGYNCFMEKELLGRLTNDRYNIVKEDVGKPCPDACTKYTNCSRCISVLGINAGSQSCVWSEKRKQCLSAALLHAKCSNGMCGQLYSKTTNSVCPAKCSLTQTCLTCIVNKECGWCSKNNDGFGDCMEGNNLAPYHGTCGLSQSSSDLSIIENTRPSSNQTWAYSDCPMENECKNNHHDCKENQICEDRVHGYICNCKKGWKMEEDQCVPHCSEGCGNGTCIMPEQCQCYFGFTGVVCNVSCACNGHSDCANETHIDICLECHNNTRGENCDKCLPKFVGNPKNNGKCVPCREVCNGNTDICMVKSEAEEIPEDVRNNSSVVLTEVGKLKNGPLYETDAMCLLCGNNSRGEKCDECNNGYFSLSRKCIPCECNGHGSVCNSKTGTQCECKQNTMSNPLCKSKCYKEQCTKCVDYFVGNPRDQKQCYKHMNTKSMERLEATPGEVLFLAATPSFTNVDIRISLDVIAGSYEVFIADNDKRFTMNDTKLHLHTTGSASKTGDHLASTNNRRKKRSTRPLEYIPAIQASKKTITTYAKYDGGVLVITNIQKRVVIIINHKEHDLSKKWFYLALRSTNKTSHTGAAKAFVYYRQDLPRIDLVLFFLVLAVILMFILSAFIISMKVRFDTIRNRRTEMQQTELNAMKSRPLALFRLLFEMNEDISILLKRKNRTQHTNKHNKHLSPSSSVPISVLRRYVRPVAIQDTEDCLAAVVTTFIQFPENEISKTNVCLGSGICQLNSQQLIQVKTNTQGNGKSINTRILNTIA